MSIFHTLTSYNAMDKILIYVVNLNVFEGSEFIFHTVTSYEVDAWSIFKHPAEYLVDCTQWLLRS